MDGDYEVIPGLGCRGGDLGSLLAVATANATNIEDQRGLLGIFNRLGDRALHIAHLSRSNTANNARRNIEEHYDAGNAMYKIFLDKSMTYSCGIWSDKNGSRIADSLYESQMNKIDELIEKSDISEGHNVLEIGCGWGGFAEYAARERDVQVTGITISDEQLAYAQARMQKAGLSDKTRIVRCDYRDVEGQFDKVASIEMFEAVGEKYWPAYFGKISDVLSPGGRAGLQIITIRDELFEKYRRRADFIQRYVFPGGMLASVERLKQETAKAGLAWRRVEAFGYSYADTLAEWARRFHNRWDDISALGFDERFRRLWLFYLGYCEAGFRTGRTDVVQLALAKP